MPGPQGSALAGAEPDSPNARVLTAAATAGLADLIVNHLGVEQSNIVIDPLLNGWYRRRTKDEQSDMCPWSFGPDSRLVAKRTTHAGSL